MSSILTQQLGLILANLADAIEGGNTHRGSGTAHPGIPGTQSHDRIVNEVASVIITEATSTTFTVDDPSFPSYQADEIARPKTPPLFLLVQSSTGLEGDANVGSARRITAFTTTAPRRFTVTAAFPSAMEAFTTCVLREGFKRAPDKTDLDDPAGAPDGGFDRFFELRALPAGRTDWLGNGVEQWNATLELRLRFEKRGRSQKALDAAIENVGILRSVLRRPSLRDGTYMQLLVPDNAPPERTLDNATMLTLRDRYSMTYRVRSDYR